MKLSELVGKEIINIYDGARLGTVGVEQGGVLQHILREVEIRCLPLDIPNLIEVDVSQLEIGDSISVGEIKAPEGVEITSELRNCLLQQLTIKIKANSQHMSMLLRSQYITGTPDFKIPFSNLKARTKFSKLLDGQQPLFGQLT
jgi:sporulation protein YlmC with PRC-barrel domain